MTAQHSYLWILITMVMVMIKMIIDDDDYDYYDCIHKHWTQHLKNISCQYRKHLTGDDPENVVLVSSFSENNIKIPTYGSDSEQELT